MFFASQQNFANALSGASTSAISGTFAAKPQAAPSEGNSYIGPERRTALASSVRWMAAMLDEVDYGMLLLSGEDQILHVNHAGRAELDASHPLQLVGRQVRARCSQDVAQLACALRAATQRGLASSHLSPDAPVANARSISLCRRWICAR